MFADFLGQGLMLPHEAVTVIVILAGLCLGSLASAMAYRMPRDISMTAKVRSACPSCAHALGFFDLFPVLSWVLLRGRCRYCRAKIGWQYPAIELSTASLCFVFYWVFGMSWAVIPLLLLAPVIIAIIDIDFRFKIIPDQLNLSIFVLGFLSLIAFVIENGEGPDRLIELAAAGIGASLAYGIGSWLLRAGAMAILKKDPMGWGDIKFFAAAGIWLGFRIDVLSGFMMIAGLSGIGLALIWKKITGDPEFPFGPSLLLAFVAVILIHGPAFMPLQ